MVHNIRITFGAQIQPQIEVQQGDYNSRTIQALCYTSSGSLMGFEGNTVSVVYEIAGNPSEEYPVKVLGNVLTFTMPGLVSSSAGAGKLQLRIYGQESLLHSAVIPYTVKASLDPGPAEEDQVPMLVMLVQQAQQAIAGANAAASTANQVAQIANTAANLASEKAGLAQNAASSANEAATNATNSAELAQTAADNANSASESANSAAGTANNAADNANSAAESANNAATNANQVADEIQQKADSGAFNGKDGLNAPQIDDTQITTTNPWSSMQIVKTLCPPFTVSGATVQCTPVANYPLGVQVEITPTQEGTGDPSPENVRPIVGWDSVNIRRGGNNMLDMDEITVSSDVNYGFRMEKIGNYIRIYGTSTETGVRSFAIAQSNQNYLYGKDFVFSWFTNEPSVMLIYGFRTVSEKSIAIQMNLQEGQVYDFTIQIALGVQKLTAYEPYQSNTYTIQLGQITYGGTLDAVTGVGSEEWELIELNGETTINTINELDNTLRASIPIITFPSTGNTGYCNVFPWVLNYNLDSEHVYANQNLLYLYVSKSRLSTIDIPGVLAYLAAQASAGTPVQVAYKLATPKPFQATGNQTIPALPGTNTLFADAGSITVTGASDPIATITALQNRVSALERAQTNL